MGHCLLLQPIMYQLLDKVFQVLQPPPLPPPHLLLFLYLVSLTGRGINPSLCRGVFTLSSTVSTAPIRFNQSCFIANLILGVGGEGLESQQRASFSVGSVVSVEPSGLTEDP